VSKRGFAPLFNILPFSLTGGRRVRGKGLLDKKPEGDEVDK